MSATLLEPPTSPTLLIHHLRLTCARTTEDRGDHLLGVLAADAVAHTVLRCLGESDCGWRSLLALESTCRSARRLSLEADDDIWKEQCDNLWLTKAFVPRAAEQLRAQNRSRDAFYVALHDRYRSRIEPHELTLLIWRIHSGGTASAAMLAKDPSRRGEPCLCKRYRDDGMLDMEVGNGPRPRNLMLSPVAWAFDEVGGRRLIQHTKCGPGGTGAEAPLPGHVISRDPDTWVRVSIRGRSHCPRVSMWL